MGGLLSFFSDLILFTAGVVVVVFWIIIIGVIAIEVYDAFTDNKEHDDAA